MSEQSNKTPLSTDESEKDKLRSHLLEGGFGMESEELVENDSVADDDVINNFISMFGIDGNTPLKGHDWVIYLPSSLLSNCNGTHIKLYGIVRNETETIYVLDYDKYRNSQYYIGDIFVGTSDYVTMPVTADCLPYHLRVSGFINTEHSNLVIELYSDNGNISDSFPVRVKQYDAVTKLFSRNTGLLESAEMLDKRAVLVGCGSVGSFVAMELARSGVGKFVLCDTDTLEIHNICRHQCGFDDLGRYKVDAVKDKILNINPSAEVITYRSIIQRIPQDELLPLLGRNTIIIGGGDNRGSADWACKLAIKTDSSFVSTCCWTRAFAGEIFYWTSGRNLSCYTCALGGLIDDERPESHATYFGSDDEKENLSFEPGVAADIDFVTIIAVKLALDLLNRDNSNYTPRVINYLKQYTWVCNTNSPKIGGDRAGIFPNPLWITNNLGVHKNPCCPYCGVTADKGS